jgi:hypothetical protein
MDSREVVAAWCGKVGMALQVGCCLEVADILVGPGSKAAHQAGVCMARMPVQLPREVPVMKAGDQWWQKHSNGGMAPFARAVIYIIRKPPWSKGCGSTPVGFLG